MQAEAASLGTPSAFRVEKSFSGRSWTWRVRDDARASELARNANISLSLAQLLCARGVSEQTAEAYLNPTLKHWLPEPLLLKDMERAVARARRALDGREKIAIFGDYDVDGSASTALLNEFLQAAGAIPRVYIPDRMTEGYGPSTRAFELLKREGASLVLCVDCGAAAREPLAAAEAGGLDVIVLDHHAVDSAPSCVAHVNPNQPDDASGQGHLCAAGVTFLFVVALNRALRESGYYARKNIAEPDLRVLLDLVALATICDVVPLTGVNRAYVRTGLARLSSLARSGVAALAAVARVNAPFTPHHLGFVFGPRINAGGRVGKCSLGAELLGTTDRARADELATLLDLHNRERQAIEKSILEEAVVAASSKGNASFLLVENEGWHSGVVGIVAGRLKDRFGKPSFVIGFEGGQGRGSARSIAGVDVGAIVRAARERSLVDGGGGHAMAAGFSLSRAQLDRFEAFLADQFAEISRHVAAALVLEIEAAISPAAASTLLVDEFAKAGPFGAGNPEPHLLVPDAQLVHAEVVGRNHVRARLRGGDGARLDAVAFRKADEPLGKALLASRGRQIHAAGRLRAEEWNGQRRVELHIEDAAPASA
jgi:single-stranded-DNA-specific exonuclease